MASSEEKPASAAAEATDGSDRSDSDGKQTNHSGRSKRKTLIGLGKLRKSLESSSSSARGTNKNSSLRIPKPPSRRTTTPGKPPKPPESHTNPSDVNAASAPPEGSGTANDDGPVAKPDVGLPEQNTPVTEDSDGGPPTDKIDGSQVDNVVGPHIDSVDGSPADDLESPIEAEPGEPMEAESTMLSDESIGADEDFGGEATLVTDSPLDSPDKPAADFGGEATLITDSPDEHAASPESGEEFGEDAEGSDICSDSSPRSLPQTPATHATHPNPPTPEQTPRHPQAPAPPETSSPNNRLEDALTEDSGPADDDFQAEQTEVFDSPYENEALVARLTVLEGPAAGQKFLLNRQRNTVGRGANNTIMVSDLAMSRQHIEILEQPDQTYLLVDLQAANGTRLNSTRIVEAELRHGDRIEAGKTEFQFIIPGDQPKTRSSHRHLIAKRDVSTPEDRTRVRQVQDDQLLEDATTDKVLTAVIVGAGILSLFLIAAAVYLFMEDSPSPQATPGVVASQERSTQALYLEGVEKIKDRQWDEAREVFEEVGARDADFPGIAAQLERVSREKRAKQALERAGTLLSAGENDSKAGPGELDEEAAKVVLSISNQSVYFEEAQDLLRKTRQRRIAHLYEKAQEDMTAENFEEAHAHLAEILAEVPNHKGALELQEALAEDVREQQQQQNADERRAKSVVRPSRSASSSNHDWLASTGSSTASSKSTSTPPVNFTKGFMLYKSEEFDDATAHFRNAASRSSGAVARRADTAAENIERFEGAYERAVRAFDAGAWKTAIDAFEDASRIDRTVARTGYFGSKIDAKLATIHGKVGLSAFDNEDFTGAHQSYAKGRGHQSSNATVNELRRKLSNKARGLYIQAANKRKTDPGEAKELCRQITSMVPASHSMHQKAKQMLGTL